MRTMAPRMRLTVIVLMLAGMLRSAMPAAAQDGPRPTGTTFQAYLPLTITAPAQTSVEQQVVELTNALRRQHGCSPLSISSQLTTAARGHSQDMADHNFVSHTGSDGSSPWDRMQRAGYAYTQAAENVAAGYATAEAVVAGWYNSPSHRANMLNCDLREIGVGYAYNANSDYDFYWTQDFGSR